MGPTKLEGEDVVVPQDDGGQGLDLGEPVGVVHPGADQDQIEHGEEDSVGDEETVAHGEAEPPLADEVEEVDHPHKQNDCHVDVGEEKKALEESEAG